MYTDPCTIALQTDKNLMAIHNPYVENLIQMGYDRQDVEVASTMFQKHTFPCVIHGRKFETAEQYYSELHEFMNGMWRSTRWHSIGCAAPVLVYSIEVNQTTPIHA